MPRLAIGSRVRILSDPFNDIEEYSPDETRVAHGIVGQVGTVISHEFWNDVDADDEEEYVPDPHDSYLVLFDAEFPLFDVYVDYDGGDNYIIRESNGASREFWFYHNQIVQAEHSLAAKDWPPTETRKRYKNMQTVELP